MNYQSLLTMLVLVLVPAIAAWWWIQRANGKVNPGNRKLPLSDTGAAKRQDPK